LLQNVIKYVVVINDMIRYESPIERSRKIGWFL